MNEIEIEILSVVMLLSLYLLWETIGTSIIQGLKRRNDRKQ